MSFHHDSSLKDLTPKHDFWSHFRPKSESGRSMLYRYENDGIVVYDNCARLSDEPADNLTQVPIRDVPPQIKKEIEGSNEYDRLQFLGMKSYGIKRVYPQEYTLVVPTEKTLKFDSKFESGNLQKAIKVNENEYNLLLDCDSETKGYTQWYYFSVKNYKSNHYVRFNLINLMKYESLYNAGMKPLVYSEESFKRTGLGWHRDGSAISYYKNSTPRKVTIKESNVPKFYYTLTFTYYFTHASDTVYFAHCYPYTHTDLLNYLNTITQKPENKSILRVDTLCRTIAGNNCPIVTITNSVDTYVAWEEELTKLQKSAAARRIMKMREFKEEAKLKVFEYVRNVKILEGKS